MTNTNENTNQNEVATIQPTNAPSIVVSETDEFQVLKENGKFVRKAKYTDYSSVKVDTRAERIWLLNLLDSDEDTGNGLKDHVGKQIEVADIITRPYDKINEDTGQQEFGVLTYLITKDKVPYITSSKGVYFSIMQMMKLFGKPHSEEWENLIIQVGSYKGQNGTGINIKMVG